MVRSYLRHEPTSAFGLICSASSNSILDPDTKTAFVPALEDVLVWDVRTGTLLATWHEIGHRSKVTALARSPTESDTFAVGYEDGSIRLWSTQTNSTSVTFNGHKKAVIAITFDFQGLRIASASLDTDIILWDLVAETGLYRLRGHRDAVTAIAFVQRPSASLNLDGPSSSAAVHSQIDTAGYLLSTSKDGLIKLWDLSLQHCVETVVHGSNEIWSLAVSQDVTLTMQVGKSADEDDGETAERDAVADGGALVLTGSADGDMKVWEISAESLLRGLQTVTDNSAPATSEKFVIPKGSIPLSGKHRVTQIEFCGVPKRSATSTTTTHGQGYIAVSSTDKAVQIFRLRSTQEMAKKMERRKKRNKEKAEKKRAKEGAISTTADSGPHSLPDQVTWTDRIEAYTSIRPLAGKLKSFSLAMPRSGSSSSTNKFGLSVLCALSTNALEIYSVPAPPRSKAEKAAPIEPVLASALEAPGHRSDIRAVALSSDDNLLASACGAGQLKIWNVKTGRCIRTLPCGYALSVAWLPGDQHVLVGCKDGTLRSFDVRAGIAVETLEAHQGPLWSVAVQPDGLGCVSASADKEVKFWEFEMQVPEDDSDSENDDDGGTANGQIGAPTKPQSPPQLVLVHVRTLKMTDDVLCARFSPNGKLLALSLLDNTVKVFFTDSLKFFLSLYGHKLPVLSLDISADSKLCVTVSADKNVKIWGLDFGDCHKSIFAHNESIMGVCFEQGQQGGGLMGGRHGDSHHFWTVGKDGLVKHWDGDNFQMIQQLEGHHGEVWAVTPDHNGKVVVTAGADRSLRVWEKTDEPLFLEEEREREMERAFESAGSTRQDEERAIGSLADGADVEADGAISTGPEATSVSKSTRETMIAGERLIEALETADADLEARSADADLEARSAARASGTAEPAFHALIMAEFEPSSSGSSFTRSAGVVDEDISAQKYVLRVVEKILPAQLEDALLVLPFDKVLSLLRYLDYWARKEWNIPLVSRILFFLLRTHHNQIVANRVMRPTLLDLKAHLRRALARQKATIGFNLAALKFIKAQHVAQKTSEIYESQGLDVDEDTIRAKIEASAVRKRKLRVT
ncbi:related to DIP2 - Dom34p-interacting protein [Melanopsichium pennsylvanicum]|uniref:Related to DIP2 - Dom34p-interacting protein n=2 Tax=Melanopsichium pennsylvanicum TaxID=63383 RepID=A0AAJ4XHL2_9BASI|nr:related to DIP2-Dom34p-interacting protein [Melanopsichium pennsylvanicum 4]SNX82534.1 related to DIP2 - Dom34p-interacting protein [Melanopsichium pennsylvanicum]